MSVSIWCARPGVRGRPYTMTKTVRMKAISGARDLVCEGDRTLESDSLDLDHQSLREARSFRSWRNRRLAQRANSSCGLCQQKDVEQVTNKLLQSVLSTRHSFGSQQLRSLTRSICGCIEQFLLCVKCFRYNSLEFR